MRCVQKSFTGLLVCEAQRTAKGIEARQIQFISLFHFIPSLSQECSRWNFAPPRRRRRSWSKQPLTNTELALLTSSPSISYSFHKKFIKVLKIKSKSKNPSLQNVKLNGGRALIQTQTLWGLIRSFRYYIAVTRMEEELTYREKIGPEVCKN